jgi:hypothetical protein
MLPLAVPRGAGDVQKILNLFGALCFSSGICMDAAARLTGIVFKVTIQCNNQGKIESSRTKINRLQEFPAAAMPDHGKADSRHCARRSDLSTQ